MPDADVTVATSCETALAVRLYGSGKKYYFAQHFEPYFCEESWNPLLAEIDAVHSYHLGLNVIANSSWLARKLSDSMGIKSVPVCVNAIDVDVFNGLPKQSVISNEIKIISYGGRNARWKGFSEMAEGVRLARLALPNHKLRWQVYGSALLPPENPVAQYESLGFLQQTDLSAAYRNADFLLSASWYESFPLFPIEAMACGLPVITTLPGTEDYVIPDITAAVVEPKEPNGIALAIQKMVSDADYRFGLASKGQIKAREFTWDKSIRLMESLLL
jgi:glycosyltransferase involved in cell wall biosynthesis